MDLSEVKDIEAFDQWLAGHNVKGIWDRDGDSTEFEPWLWKWEELYAALVKAADFFEVGFGGRRNINLINPGVGRRRPSHTMSGSLQYLMPGDTAQSHRHMATTCRWVVNGDAGAFSVMDGEAFPLLEGDLLVAPPYAWHGHYHEGQKPMIWLTATSELLRLNHGPAGATYPERIQPVDKPEGWWSSVMSGPTRPTALPSGFLRPPYRYRWAETQAALMTLKQREESDPFDGIILDFTNPLDGGPTFSTMAARIQLLTPHETTRAHRHNSTTIYQAFRGSGVTVADGKRLEWSQGDIFVIPPWAIHHHENLRDDDAILYSLGDDPVWRGLGVYFEEHDPVPEPIGARSRDD
jgi:gentisate 1,2-dioxygenase